MIALPRQHPLFIILRASGVTDATVRPGLMHTSDLGVLLYLHGGVLRTLVTRATTSVPGRSQEVRLGNVWKSIQEFYVEFKIDRRLHRLTLTKFTGATLNDFPCLKAILEPVTSQLHDGRRLRNCTHE